MNKKVDVSVSNHGSVFLFALLTDKEGKRPDRELAVSRRQLGRRAENGR